MHKLNNICDFIKRYRHFVIIFFIGCISLVGFTFVYKVKVKPISESYRYTREVSTSKKNVIKADGEQGIVEQSFIAKDGISGFALRLEYNNKHSDGIAKVELLNEDKSEVIQSWIVNKNEIVENNYYEFILDNYIKEAKGNKYYININLINEKDLGIYSSNEDEYIDGDLIVNGKAINGDLCLLTYSSDSQFLKSIFIVAAIIGSIFLIIIYYFIFIKRAKIHNVFLVAGVFIGIGYMFLSTPYSGFDEPAHIDTAYRYSNYFMGKGTETETGGVLKREEDTSMGLTWGATNISAYRTVYDNFTNNYVSGREFDYPGRFVKEAPYAYLASSIAITVGRILDLGQIPLLYLGRFFNLLVYIGIIYFAIKKVPFAKMIFFVAALTPLAVFQGASFSYDSPIIAITFLFTSYCLYVAFSKENVDKKDYFLLLLSAMALAPFKMVYVLICLLGLIIPKKRFTCNKKYYMYIGGVIFAIITMYLLVNLGGAIRVVTETQGESAFSTAASYTFSDILHQPIQFAKVLINSLRENFVSFVLLSINGLYLINIHGILTYSFFILLVLAALKQKDEEQYITTANKILMGIIIVGVILALYTVGFTWTPNGKTVIDGVQGRYLIPLFPLIFLLLRNKNLTFEKNIDKKLMFSLCCVQIMTLCSGFLSVITK
ncbi:MAG: DUF2142 domain-containing protein [Clostridium sp.]|uniref:DUF2142 domain-containing protein n=1 Tax=Clostridium sp. TaxID=1506 RepID=UPI00290EBAF8|nr:DUF2142 domain-containing protein [Clostridium sp.]MDU4937991.1 DUF2142 domain-containing protein [Clostridium sp.]